MLISQRESKATEMADAAKSHNGARARNARATYGAAWFIVSWLCLQVVDGDPLHRLITAAGIGVLHASVTALIRTGEGRRITLQIALYIGFSTMLLLVLLLYGFYVQSGGVLDQDAVRAIAQTNLHESIAYMAQLVTPQGVLLGSSAAVLLIALFPSAPWRRTLPERSSAAAPLAILLAAFGLALAYIGFRPMFSVAISYASQYRAETKAFKEVLSRRRMNPIQAASAQASVDVIIIIGESTARSHMGLYGYHRDTTPRLQARLEAADNHMVVFSDVISSHSHTVPALASAMTSSGASEEQEFFSQDSIDIVSLARAASLQTFWLSNQNEFGVWDNPIAALAKGADQSTFYSSALGRSFRRSVHDEAILPELRRLLNEDSGEPNMALFVHLFAAHWPYCDAYPQQFRQFREPLGEKFFGAAREPGDVNCYDDAVTYVDWLVDQIITLAQGRTRPTAVLYFSDHGEAPLLGTGHESAKHSSYHLEIPFILWTNDAFALTWKIHERT